MGRNDHPVVARGVYSAVLTPRQRESTEANAAGFLDYLDRVMAAGIDGLLLFGSTGEFIHYDMEERMRVLSLAAKRSRVPLLVNISHSSLAGAVALAEQAAEAGAAGLMLMPPYFFHYGDEEIEAFYSAFLGAVEPELPVYLYSLPSFTSPISADVTERLLRSGRFAGIKDSSGDWESLHRLLLLRREQPLQVLVGNESVYHRGLLAGADGVVSGISAALPELPVAMQRAVAAGRLEAADRLAVRVKEFLNWVDQFPATVVIKYAAELRGWLGAELAVPLGRNACERIGAFREWFVPWLPQTLAECASVRT
jgi:dihydrodipicolinate synthase/N-acetylneuraminate lyase